MAIQTKIDLFSSFNDSIINMMNISVDKED